MRFINAIIYREDCKFHKGSFSVDKGLFTDEIKDDEIIDLEGRYVIPGLVDIHLHGNSGVDFSEADYEGLKRIANYLAKQGITSFSPASMTLDEVLLKNAYKNAVRLRDERPANSSRIRGITMEGPFLSLEKRGAHKKEHLKLPDLEMYLRLQEYAEGMIGLVCVAPELEGCLEFIRKVSKECTVSIAHTTASYEVVKKAIRAGATHITHLFNAMPPFHHRNPGVIGAAFEDQRVTAELVCDGKHLHESVVRAAFKLFSAERIVLVSDSLSATGMPDGKYRSGGCEIEVKQGIAYLLNSNTLAGSVTNLYDCMLKAISYGIKKEDAIRAATINPAKVINCDNIVGSISIGKSADFIICDQELKIKEVYIEGVKVSDD